MTRHLRVGPLLAVLTLRPAAAQVYSRPDSARIASAVDAGAKLVHWVETTTEQNEQAVYLKNTSGQAIQVTSFEVFDCQNLRGSVCGVHAPGPTVPPGKAVELVVVDQAFRGAAWSFKYRFSARFLEPPDARPAMCDPSCGRDAVLEMDSIAPPPGSTLTADSTLQLTIRYHVPEAHPGQWVVALMFQGANPRVMVSLPVSDTAAGTLPDSMGVFRLTQPLDAAAKNPSVARPLGVFVFLFRKESLGRRRGVARVGPFAFPISEGQR